jgi:hypothetical protein
MKIKNVDGKLKDKNFLERDSQTLIDILEKNSLNNFVFNENSKKILKNFHSYFINSFINLEKINFDNKLIKINNQKDIPMPHDGDFDYIISYFKNYIKTKSLYYFSYKNFKLLGKIININFILYDDKQPIDKYCFYILFWLHVLIKNFATNKSCSSVLNIFIYLTPEKKKLPKLPENSVINKIHVNTGFTVSCQKTSNIVIYRKEEWFKVFIHETIHNLGLDFSLYYDENDSTINNLIKEMFAIKNNIRLYEAYTDAWATIINSLIVSFISLDDIEKKDIKNFFINFEYFFNFERNFIIFQVIKILHFMKLDYKKLISKNDIDRKESKKKYNEYTNVLAYYIIKSNLIFNLDEFLIWCKNNNKNLLQFNNDKSFEKQQEFCFLIKKLYDDKLYLENLNKIEQIFYLFIKNKNSQNNINIFVNTLRKTTIELI